jgi:hypothetical protein
VWNSQCWGSDLLFRTAEPAHGKRLSCAIRIVVIAVERRRPRSRQSLLGGEGIRDRRWCSAAHSTSVQVVGQAQRITAGKLRTASASMQRRRQARLREGRVEAQELKRSLRPSPHSLNVEDPASQRVRRGEETPTEARPSSGTASRKPDRACCSSPPALRAASRRGPCQAERPGCSGRSIQLPVSSTVRHEADSLLRGSTPDSDPFSGLCQKRGMCRLVPRKARSTGLFSLWSGCVPQRFGSLEFGRHLGP